MPVTRGLALAQAAARFIIERRTRAAAGDSGEE